MKTNLSCFEAYKAMCCFLENYYVQTGSDDVGALLGSMQLLEDKTAADPAIWDEWKECFAKALQGET